MHFNTALFFLSLILIFSCNNNINDIKPTDETIISSCTGTIIEIDTSRGDCNTTLSFNNEVSITLDENSRIITSNNIPTHQVGLFGNVIGSINPNSISPQNANYTISLNPIKNNESINLEDNGPNYSFGILLNGVEVDPIAAEPWPHTGSPGNFPDNVNWDWNLEASMVDIGLDCNNAHVQPTGKYHYHGIPKLYLETLVVDEPEMLLVGYAADGFPIYYRYGYYDPNDINTEIIDLKTSYALKTGDRPGDGEDAPCREYSGVYTNDYEFINASGDLDSCNGRIGITPEYPDGTYYYIIASNWPSIPRCFMGTPSNDFEIGG